MASNNIQSVAETIVEGHAVSLCCQRCGHLLKLHSSLEGGLDASSLQQVTAMPNKHQAKLATPYPDLVIPEHKQKQAKICTTEAVDLNGFNLVSEVDETREQEEPRHNIEAMQRLFDFISGQSDIDQPLCEDCTDVLLDHLDELLKHTENQCNDYKELLERLSVAECSAEEETQLQAELAQLEADEAHLREQLNNTWRERTEVQAALNSEKTALEEVSKKHELFLKDYNHFKFELHSIKDDSSSVQNQTHYVTEQLKKLKKTNIFNTTFHIWHDGAYGTINGFRLGRMPGDSVSWDEINAAWGQTALLLHSLCNKMQLKLERFRIVPMGNSSYIESLADKGKELPLFGHGGPKFKFLWDKGFDTAMVAFLDCVQQFKQAVEKGDSGFTLPYKMEKGKITDTSTSTTLSIKTQFNSEEQWTKALKFMLTNLKWGLAWVSSQLNEQAAANS